MNRKEFMKNISEEKKKKIIMILIGILLFVVVFLLAFAWFHKDENKKEDKEPEIQANTNKNVIKDQEVGGFRFSNTSLIIENGESKLTTEVKNITDQDLSLQSFDIIVKDKNGKEMTTLLGYVGESIKVGEVKTLTSETDVDLTNASSIEYVLNPVDNE